MSDQAVIAELTRVTALFQARALAAIMGLPLPVTLSRDEQEPDPTEDGSSK